MATPGLGFHVMETSRRRAATSGAWPFGDEVDAVDSFLANFSRLNPALFALAGDLGQAAFFYRHPKRNPSSLGGEASKKPSERQSRKGFKNGP